MKYRYRPIEIEAYRFCYHKYYRDLLEPIPEWVSYKLRHYRIFGIPTYKFEIKTTKGWVVIYDGDYIIFRENGLELCKPDIFKNKYEKIPAANRLSQND